MSCTPFDKNGHAPARISLIDPSGPDGIAPRGEPGVGRLTTNPNGLSAFTNPETNVTVPPLSVVVSFAQDHPERGDAWTEPACGTFDFGPTTGNGLWSTATSATAFLPVPSLSSTGKLALSLFTGITAFALVATSRHSCEKRTGTTSLQE